MHERALANVTNGGPYNLADAVLGVDQYYCLGSQSLRRLSPPSGEVAPKNLCRVGAGFGGKRTPEKIYAPTRVTRRITWVPAELRGAEVPRSTPPSREGPVVILGIEGPDVEILDTVASVHVVQGSALAQGPAQEAPGVPAGTMRIPPEQLRLGVGGQRGQPKQISYFDPRRRPIRIRGHAAILSRRAPVHPVGQELRHNAKVSSVASTVEHPDIRYVVYPVHLDGSRTGANPRLRHDPDCSHFEWGDGTILGTPELATEEQMRTLRACKTCVAVHAESSKDARSSMKDGRIGEVCPTCNRAMSLTGICDNCSW
jgi:hypothetical protein